MAHFKPLFFLVLAVFSAIVNAADLRELQERTIYATDYAALFQRVSNDGCYKDLTQEKPVIELYCAGEYFSIGGVSDSTIECNVIDYDVNPGLSAPRAECINTCAAWDDCQKVFHAFGLDAIYPNWGVIYYSCGGDDSTDVDSFSVYKAGEASTCSGDLFSKNPNYHVSQLGVACDGTSGGYRYYDSYIACDSESELTFFTFRGGKRATCINGRRCGTQSCEVEFDDLMVSSKSDRFDESCIQRINVAESDLLPPGTPPPTPASLPSGEYSADYFTQWQRRLSDVSAQVCDTTINLPVIQLRCNGGDIKLVDIPRSQQEGGPPSIECTSLSPSELQCRETCADCNYYIAGKSSERRYAYWASVVFTCAGTTLEETFSTVEWLESEESCDFPELYTFPNTVSHLVTNSAYCANGGLTSDDYFFECIGSNSNILDLGDKYYSCSNGDEVRKGDSTGIVTVPRVTIQTVALTEGCYTAKTPTGLPQTSPGPAPNPTPVPSPTEQQTADTSPEPTGLAPNPTKVPSVAEPTTDTSPEPSLLTPVPSVATNVQSSPTGTVTEQPTSSAWSEATPNVIMLALSCAVLFGSFE